MQFLWSVPGRDLEKEALDVAKQADTVVMFMGLSPRLEGEEMRVEVQGFKGGDRLTLNLPAIQEDLMRKIVQLGKPTVLVLLNGSAVAVNWAHDHIPAILTAWYPGQAAGTAIADVLFGDFNPGGRLPVTYYKSVDQIPPFEDYGMAGRTYRYFKGDPLYPFGFGLSYTKFEYSDLRVPKSISPDGTLQVSAQVRNAGNRSGDEVIQLYLSYEGSAVAAPIRQLAGFQRVTLKPGESRTVQFNLTRKELELIDAGGRPVSAPGPYEISIGGKQPGFKGGADAASTSVVEGRFEVRAK